MFNELIKSDKVKQLHQQPKKEIDFPTIKGVIHKANMLHQIDILYLPKDKSGLKYGLNVVDVQNSIVDGRPIETFDLNMIVRVLENIYDTSEYLHLGYPNAIQGDQEFNKKTFKDWCNVKGINFKPTMPYRHRQNSYVENANKLIGNAIWGLVHKHQLETGKPLDNWHQYYPKIIEIINRKRLKYVNEETGTNKQRNKNKNEFNRIINKNNNYIILKGTRVRLMIPKDRPIDLHGYKLYGNRRSADIKWDDLHTYVVKYPVILPNNPIMYAIKDEKTGKKLPALFTTEQLQII